MNHIKLHIIFQQLIQKNINKIPCASALHFYAPKQDSTGGIDGFTAHSAQLAAKN
jgi:hypothetical protein